LTKQLAKYCVIAQRSSTPLATALDSTCWHEAAADTSAKYVHVSTGYLSLSQVNNNTVRPTDADLILGGGSICLR